MWQDIHSAVLPLLNKMLVIKKEICVIVEDVALLMTRFCTLENTLLECYPLHCKICTNLLT